MSTTTDAQARLIRALGLSPELSELSANDQEFLRRDILLLDQEKLGRLARIISRRAV
jgi:hypothetical protein